MKKSHFPVLFSTKIHLQDPITWFSFNTALHWPKKPCYRRSVCILFHNLENNYNYFKFYLLCNPDISHLITYSTLSGNCDSTSFFRRRSKKGLKTLCKRRIIKIVSSSFNSTFSPWNNINQIRLSLLFLKFFFEIKQE